MNKKDEFTDRERELYNSVPPADTMTPVEEADKYMILSLDSTDKEAHELDDHSILFVDEYFTDKSKAKKAYSETKDKYSNVYLVEVISKSECI